MRRSLSILGAIGAALSVLAAEEPRLPAPNADLSQEIEPPLLFENLAPEENPNSPPPRSASVV